MEIRANARKNQENSGTFIRKDIIKFRLFNYNHTNLGKLSTPPPPPPLPRKALALYVYAGQDMN
jgi:hypothetical protein